MSWFTGLSKKERKVVLSMLHEVRTDMKAKESQGLARPEDISLLLGLLRALESEHGPKAD